MSEEFILSGPGSPPPGVSAGERVPLGMKWIGWDGSEWDLTNFQGGVLLDRRGLQGLHEPPMTKFKSRSRAVPGSRSRGWRADDREVLWPIYLWAGSSPEWVERHRRFFRSIHPEYPGRWQVRAPDGEVRELALTGVFSGDHVDEVDPVQRGWQQYGVELEAVSPFWQGPLIERGPWKAPASTSFFPGPPFTIGAGTALGTAFVPNPGDVAGSGIWWVVGPLTDVELGVGGAVITLPFNVADGETLRLDTDTRRPTATLGDTPPIGANGPAFSQFVGTESKTREVGLQRWGAVPPGLAVPVHVEATGAGEIRYHLRPQYRRAF